MELPVASTTDEVNAEVAAARTTLLESERNRAVARSSTRAPPSPHKQKGDWPTLAPSRAYQMHLENENMSYKLLSAELSKLLSGAQGGVQCIVPTSTVRSWVRRERLAAEKRASDAASGLLMVQQQR